MSVPEGFRYMFPSPYVPTPANDNNNNNNAPAIQHPVAPMLAINPVNPAAPVAPAPPQQPQNAGNGNGNDVPAIVDQGPRGPDAIRGQLLLHFTDRRRTPGFHFVKFLGQVTYGTAALVTDTRENGPPCKLVVKRGFGKTGQWGVKRGIEYLKVERGGQHFAQLLAFRNRLDDDPLREIRELLGTRGRYLQALPRPTLVTDYVENGTFADFYSKCCAMDKYVPKRLLWSILLCGKHPKPEESATSEHG